MVLKNYEITFEIFTQSKREIKKTISMEELDMKELAQKHGLKYKVKP